MDLDLLAESESDDESIHSNQDNVSVQRSAVTMATAGSDAGKLFKVIQFTGWVVESIKWDMDGHLEFYAKKAFE